MLPDMAESIWASVGRGVFASSAAADISWPDWQYPHCGTCSATHATCSGCVEVGDSPSMVVIFFPAAAEAAVVHDRTALPSRCTVQAPHWPRPHPNLVPVSPMLSRITQSRGMSGLTSTSYRLPFTSKVMGALWIAGP